MRIGHKLYFSNAIIAGLAIVAAYQAFSGIKAIETDYSRIERETFPIVEALDELRFAGLEIVTATTELGLILTLGAESDEDDVGGQDDVELEERKAGEANYFAAFEKYSSLVEAYQPEDAGTRDVLDKKGRILVEQSREVVRLLEGGISGEEVLDAKEELEDAEIEFKGVVDAAIEVERDRLSDRSGQVSQSIASGVNTTTIFAIILIAMAIAISYFLSRAISRPIVRLTDAIALVAKGKFVDVQDPKSHDEIGQLIASFQRMSKDLKQSVAERRQAQDRLQSLNESLESIVAERTKELESAQEELLRTERLSALGQVTATVAHELRNPLSAIRNTVFLIGEKAQDKGLERMFARTERNISRCDRIVNELLDYARAKTLNVESKPLDAWLAEVLAEQTVPEGITVRSELEACELELAFDADRLRRAVINVFDNACQAMAGWLEKEPDHEGLSLTVRTSWSGGNVEIRFVDTGPGMTPDVLAKVFEPLFSTKGFGVGLGMPTVKQIMEQHGGGIEVSSEPEQGTTVVLRLPIENQQEEAA